MRKLYFSLLAAVAAGSLSAQTWVRVNNLGYLPDDRKVAVLISTEQTDGTFEVFDASDDRLVFKGKGVSANASRWGMKSAYRLDFSAVERPGGYYVRSNGTESVRFRIGPDVYDGTADFLLTYLRQQRCGANPYTGAVCHAHDGYIVDHPTRSGEYIDVTGGWHDATDYLQYVTTSATAVYQLLFAYEQQQDKSVFRDHFNEAGLPGSNGIPDILDEARWGLEWLLKMNPEHRMMFNQIADDRDHAGFRRPEADSVDYGWGPGTGRPVYYLTGNPQGLASYRNRTTGVSSTAGKFASAFALGSEVFRKLDPDFSGKMLAKAYQAYDYALEEPGNTQTACNVSPYFYEEDTYTDDIELAAATFARYTGESRWMQQADYWGELEPVTPWMELGRGRHYQYYPFVNLGHYYLASSAEEPVRAKYVEFLRRGLQALKDRAGDDPFLNGIPFIWCSNNLTSAAITQARLYHRASGDPSFLEMEAALRDWLLGCNPWGTSMIVGMPVGYDYPEAPHSSYTVHNGDLTYGGLVDGPVYNEVFRTRAGTALTGPDAYAVFNNGIAVYHDDIGDYASNEPTMDGTAGLAFYLADREAHGKTFRRTETVRDRFGAHIRINPDRKQVYLVFSADSLFNGGSSVLRTLKRQGVKASFFLTGNCLRMPEHAELIARIQADGHYLGAHSDRHLLYAAWDRRDSCLVGRDSLMADMRANLAELARLGIPSERARWVLPPYEYYNAESVSALEALGMHVVNLTPGTATNADYTTPDMPNYRTSDMLIESLYYLDEQVGLNGAVILIHPGVSSERTDPLYLRLTEIIRGLKRRGYSFASFADLEY